MMEACCCSSSSAPSASILAAAPDASLRRRFSAPAGGRAAARPLRASAVTLATGAVPRRGQQEQRRRRRGAGVVRAVFERFTERAVKAVVFSQREARGMGDEAVAPHHLLLGLVAEDRSPTGFLGSGLRVDRAREACRDALGKLGPAQAATGLATDVPFSAASKRVFEAAVDFSRNMGCNFISPEHIALGLFNLEDPTTKSVLKSLGADPSHLTKQALARVQGELVKDGREPVALSSFKLREKSAAGAGKSAIVKYSNKRKGQRLSHFIGGKRILSLDVALLMAGAKERGELEARITSLLREVRKAGDVMLFIDEVHTLIGSGIAGRGSKGTGLDIANLLKPALARGELQCIASTTLDEHRLHFEKDKALARRFQPVIVNEPSQEDAVKILLGLREKYETFHKCKYTLEGINAAVYLSARYIPDRHLPDKAIDLIDEAGSRARMESFKKKKEEQCSILSKSPDEYWQEIRAVQSMHEVGRRVSFKNTLIVMTSNVGSASISSGRRSIGFSTQKDTEDTTYAAIKSLVMEELKAFFRPELLNRMDEVVVFRPLEKTQMMTILNIILQDVKSRLLGLGIGLEITDSMKNLISQQGYDRSYGARPLRRAVTQLVEDVISEAILFGQFKPGDTILMDTDATGKPCLSGLNDQTVQFSDPAPTL
nr:unnamed protein product [Digitaria exilis]